MTDSKKRSKEYERFEYRMFEMKDDLRQPLLTMIGILRIYAMNEEEKSEAQAALMAALEKKFDRRWLWGMVKFKTKEAYDFVMNLFDTEDIISIKVQYADSLLRMNPNAPVLDFVKQVLRSDESSDTRIKALSALYPLSNAEFDNEEQHHMYLSILFDSMADEDGRIRLASYKILKDHYEMTEFTPSDVPVLKILKSDEYEKAVQLFRDRIQSIEVTPIDREKIVQWIHKLSDGLPDIAIADCETCSKIPNWVEADMTLGESLDEYKSKLEIAVHFGYRTEWAMRCPICGRFYLYKYESALANLWMPEIEDESLDRITIDDLMGIIDRILVYTSFTKVLTCGTFMKLGFPRYR